MKYNSIIALAGVMVLLPVLSVLAGPAVEIPEPLFDFGRVCQKAQVAHIFWIKSVGDDTLRITRIESGCGCTKAPIGDSMIAPGDSTALEIFFSTKSYRNKVSKRPYLETNAGENKVYVKISAVLVPVPDTVMPISLKPYNLDISQFTTKPRRRARFLIENKSDQDYELTMIDWSRQHFDVKLPEQVKAGETADGMVIVHEDMIEAEFEQSLTRPLSLRVTLTVTAPSYIASCSNHSLDWQAYMLLLFRVRAITH